MHIYVYLCIYSYVSCILVLTFYFSSRDSARSYYSQPPFQSSFLGQPARGKGARPSGSLSHTITPVLLCSALRLRLFGKIPNSAPLTFFVSPVSTSGGGAPLPVSGAKTGAGDAVTRGIRAAGLRLLAAAGGGDSCTASKHLAIWDTHTPTSP
jgi:hypothetical protein